MTTPDGFDPLGHETCPEDLLALRALGMRQWAEAGPAACGSLVAVEVGTWAGRTALVLAEHFHKVFCVDHWHGNPEDRLGDLATLYGPRHAFRTFSANMGDLLMRTVFPCRGSSRDWAAVWPRRVKADLVFIDADHRYEEVAADIALWTPHVRPGGVVCGHDHGSFPGVTRAVDEAFPGRELMGRSIWWTTVPSPSGSTP